MEKLGITKVHHYEEMIIFGVFWNQSQRFMTKLRNFKNQSQCFMYYEYIWCFL